MKKDKLLLKISMFSTAFALVISGVVVHKNVSPTKLEAAQHINNYADYTYSGTYYDSITSNLTDGLNGTLRTTLTTLTYPKAWYSYDNDLPSMLPQIDKDPTNSNNMVLFYSRDSVSKSTSGSWNKEHVWPRSKSDNNFQYSGAGCDLLHIRPTYTETNSKRGSLMMGEVADSYAVEYNNMTYAYVINNSKFEPINAVKGDVARIFMYLWTAYRGQYSLNMLNVIESYNTLLTWHTLDKPDALEGSRNDYAQSSNQKNRNPFVDHPEYAWRIFGDSVDASVKNACMTAYPADGYTPGPSGDTTTVSKATSLEVGDTVVLTNDSNKKQFNGISSSSTTYGIAQDYSGETPSGTIGQLEVAQGYNNSTLAFKYEGNYLSWSSGNSLEAKSSVDANSSWVVTFNNDVPTIKNAADNSRLLQYNAGNPRFACYTSGQAEVTLWKVTSSSGSDPITPTGITVSPTFLSLEVGGSQTLTATLSPDGATGDISWSSSGEAVAIVDQDGKVSAVGGGTATITATCGTLSATCAVTVSEPVVGEDAIYNLKSCGETSSYTASSDITFSDGKIWNIPGNQTLSYGLKMGGRLSSATDRAMYSKSSYDNVSSIVITHGGKDNAITVNSVKLYVYDSADKAAAGNVNNAVEVVVGTFVDNGITTFEPASGNPWQNKYFRIVYNLSSSESGSNKGVVLTELKIQYAPQSNFETIKDYLDTANTYATIHGRETGTTAASITFADCGYSNAEEVENANIGDGTIKMACSIGSNASNAPKYYDNGTNLRFYSGNALSFSSDNADAKIIKIKFTFTPGNATGISTSLGSFDGEVWQGDEASITFAFSAKVFITKIEVTYYTDTYSVDNVSIRFGASISKANWNAIHQANEDWTIEDYGVMMLKKETLQGYGDDNTVEKAYRAGKNVNIVRKVKPGVEYADPYGPDTVYSFTARLSFSLESQYNVVIAACPFVVVSGTYYFLGEEDLEFSVNSLAGEYVGNANYNGGSSLSNKALNYLSTAH